MGVCHCFPESSNLQFNADCTEVEKSRTQGQGESSARNNSFLWNVDNCNYSQLSESESDRELIEAEIVQHGLA